MEEVSQLKSKTMILFMFITLFFSLAPIVSEAQSDQETERILVTYDEAKSPSRQSNQSTKVEVIEVRKHEVDETIDRLKSNRDVKHVEEDQPVYLMETEGPNDPLFHTKNPGLIRSIYSKDGSMSVTNQV